jgi:hypothetical protein
VLEFKLPLSSAMEAKVVIGQVDFTHGASGSGQNQLFNPQGISLDKSGNLWVSDASNNRVLEFQPPFTTGMNASLVIGQPDFNSVEEGQGAGDFTQPLAAKVKP